MDAASLFEAVGTAPDGAQRPPQQRPPEHRAQSSSAAPAAAAPPRAALCSGDTWGGMDPVRSTGSTEQRGAAGGERRSRWGRGELSRGAVRISCFTRCRTPRRAFSPSSPMGDAPYSSDSPVFKERPFLRSFSFLRKSRRILQQHVSELPGVDSPSPEMSKRGADSNGSSGSRALPGAAPRDGAPRTARH